MPPTLSHPQSSRRPSRGLVGVFSALTLPVWNMSGTNCLFPVVEPRLSASCAPNFKLCVSKRIGDGSRCEKNRFCL